VYTYDSDDLAPVHEGDLERPARSTVRSLVARRSIPEGVLVDQLVYKQPVDEWQRGDGRMGGWMDEWMEGRKKG